MSDPIEFTGNYEDLSTDLGYQFKFYCQRCGNGYMSSFERSTLGTASSVLRGASNLFGGILGNVADASYEWNRAVGGPGHDDALRRAVAEIRPRFVQCRHCGQWRCRDVCFNPVGVMCKDCAPVSQDVETSMRAQHVETQVTNDLFLEENQRMSAKAKAVAAQCAHCGGPTLGKRFCPDCGKPTGLEAAICPRCQARSKPGAKFCGECGAPIAR
jgi:hypothetical protein